MSVCCWWCSPGEFLSMVCRPLIKTKKTTTWAAPPGLSHVLRDFTTSFVGRSVHPSVHRSVSPSVRWSVTLYFFGVHGMFWLHPHTTGVAVRWLKIWLNLNLVTFLPLGWSDSSFTIFSNTIVAVYPALFPYKPLLITNLWENSLTITQNTIPWWESNLLARRPQDRMLPLS